MNIDDEATAITITKPNSRRKSLQIGIDDFGEFIRPDTNQSLDFFYDVIFNPE